MVDSVFDDVVVCIPTVRPRASVLAMTLGEWRRFGVEPLVQLQPDDWPLGCSQRRNADETLRRALAECPNAAFVLFSEDDILLAPELELWLPALKILNAPATLYLNGLQHYPRDIQRRSREGQPLPERIIRVRRLGIWYGSLAVLLPRAVADAVLLWESALWGWDIHVQAFLLRNGFALFAPVPNPVQHRGVQTTHRPDAGWERSATFGLPCDGAGTTPASLVDWSATDDSLTISRVIDRRSIHAASRNSPSK